MLGDGLRYRRLGKRGHLPIPFAIALGSLLVVSPLLLLEQRPPD